MSTVTAWVVFYLAGISVCIAIRSPIFLGRPRRGFVGDPVLSVKEGAVPPDEFFSQKLDHFNDVDDRTWQQRYFMNDQYYNKGGPVFMMLAGEAEANPVWMVNGQWINYAKQYGALTLMLEHRYYGKSHPTSDLSTANLQYLSVEQALADVADFKEYVCSRVVGLNETKWIVFGGSYSGSLSAWFRLKYPNLVDGAVASSAPIYAIINFEGCLEAVTQSLYVAGPYECSGVLYNATLAYESMVSYEGGRKELEMKLSRFMPQVLTGIMAGFAGVDLSMPPVFFTLRQAFSRIELKKLLQSLVTTSQAIYASEPSNSYLCWGILVNASNILQNMANFDTKIIEETLTLCDKLDASNLNDISNLFSILASNIESVVQYNKDNRQFEGAKATDITIEKVCQVLTDFSPGKTLIDTYGDMNTMILKAYDLPCLDYKYNKMIARLKEAEWTSDSAGGDRQWLYQTCTEFGFFQTSDSYAQPFGEDFPLSFFLQQCQDVFGPKFTETLLQHGVERTNLNYGGYGIQGSKIVFPNGSLDPWHTLSLVLGVPTLDDVTAIFINGTAHCADMYPSSAHDPPQLIEAREVIRKTVGRWLMP